MGIKLVVGMAKDVTYVSTLDQHHHVAHLSGFANALKPIRERNQPRSV